MGPERKFQNAYIAPKTLRLNWSLEDYNKFRDLRYNSLTFTERGTDMKQDSRYIRWLEEIKIEDIPIVGGKNASFQIRLTTFPSHRDALPPDRGIP
jgi:hypothetical protein